MQDIKLTDKDIQFDYVNGNKEVVQSAEIILGTRKGEFSFAHEMGLRRTNLLGKRSDIEIAASDVYVALQQEERLKNVNVKPILDERNRSITLKLTGNIGETKAEMEVDYA